MSILRPGTNCLGIYQTDRCGLLVDGCDYYRAFYRAARQAKRYILMAGWQFDSEVRLLRGEEAQREGGDLQFLHVLERLCREAPELEIYILAWDFSLIFAMEREWFQNMVFNWSTHKTLHFYFDSRHPAGATHHQKFVVVDGQLAFVGGMDICSARWDDRQHRLDNPERTDVDGTPYGAYHDVQAYLTGPVVAQLADLFVRRWSEAGAEPFQLPAAPGPVAPDTAQGLSVASPRVAVSRTHGGAAGIYEIRSLFLDAIASAQALVYLENQYFSSEAVYWGLVSRMAASGRPRLQIVMILPDRLPFTEELFLGRTQTKMLNGLRRVAEQTGHELGIYSTVCAKLGVERQMTFIHSKVLLVDDRFLTVGSANLTNRSLGLDTELNVSWESDPESPEPGESIRRVRASLLAEHAGRFAEGGEEDFLPVEGLVRKLDRLAQSPQARLCGYFAEGNHELWSEALEPISRVVDPDKPLDGEFLYEEMTRYDTGMFAKGILVLSRFIATL